MFRKKKPSQILIDYVEGKGRGDEIDDYIHGNLSEEEERQVVVPLLEISRKYSSSNYFIGISDPDSFNEILALARGLQKKNL